MTKRSNRVIRKISSGNEDQAENNLKIKVLFLDVLTEITQTGVRHYHAIKSFNDLRHRIEDEFPGISNYDFRIAVNDELTDDVPKLKNGDTVTFLPLFAGDGN